MNSSAVRCPNCHHELALVDAHATAANDAVAETFDAWAERWFAQRRGADVDRERARYRQWMSPTLGAVDVRRLSRADVELWVEEQDAVVARGELRWGTARRSWIQLRSMLGDTWRAKSAALRVRSDNPISGLRGPDRGDSRASTFLRPSEFLQLVSCRRVPRADRRRYALAVYLGVRAAELAALEWDDVDLSSGTIHVHRSLGRDGAAKSTKTGVARQFAIERKLLPLLRAMHRTANAKTIDAATDRRGLSADLRRHLRWAGCAREALYASTDTQRPLTFHDLRATSITWQAMRGDPIGDVMERVGHAQIMTTQGYMRRGRLMATASGERVFPKLPAELFRKK